MAIQSPEACPWNDENPNTTPHPAATQKPAPRAPRSPAVNEDVRPKAPPSNVKVTPLDDGEAIEKGIEIKET